MTIHPLPQNQINSTEQVPVLDSFTGSTEVWLHNRNSRDAPGTSQVMPTRRQHSSSNFQVSNSDLNGLYSFLVS
jgi:hypothetical protein